MCEFTKSKTSQVEEAQEIQQKQLKKEPKLFVVDACQPSNGILRMSEEEKEIFAEVPFEKDTCFFIPASGSGSRMFGFLFQFIADGIETKEVQYFIENLERFPFYQEFRERVGESFASMTKKEIIEFLLLSDAMGLSSLPKGMIPFHSSEAGVLKPFQEHYLQFSEIADSGKIHYTVQEDFLDEIKHSVKQVSNNELKVEYSFQDSSTDAYCFDLNGAPATHDGELIKRPAGHGSLLKNLNQLNAEIICVKNIDNIQPTDRHQTSLKTWKVLHGVLDTFHKDLQSLADSFSSNSLEDFNTKYEVFREEELSSVNGAHIHKMCDRPTRVCGMVVNEGAPGGGPFWVEYDGVATKQIVEKVQLPQDAETKRLMESSTHFNPVFIVLDPRTVNGERRDLNEFVDKDSFIRVNKDHKGQQVVYHELPGLWNGSMAFWNTIFVEIPKDVFTPVKTVLDLIGKDHVIS
jgi:hypothetical protein